MESTIVGIKYFNIHVIYFERTFFSHIQFPVYVIRQMQELAPIFTDLS